MKTKRPLRAVSFILTLIMLVGMLPLSAISSMAAIPAVDSSVWTLVGTDSKASNAARYTELKDALENTAVSLINTAYVRLERDIKLDADLSKSSCVFTEDSITIVVTRKVVFDLNGHTLKAKVYDGTGEYLDPVSLTMFEIRDGGKLTIVDSKGKGKIATDSWISEPHVDLGAAGDINVFDMFKIKGGGELIINASGAEFECGRSKQQWVTRAYTVDREPGGVPDASDFFTGNIRGQACGSVFIAESNSKITVAGGKFLARGYRGVYHRGYGDPCAVFDVSANTVVDIIDGTFYGKGCADVFDADKTAKITIRSGVFDVFKVDKVPVLNYPYHEDLLSYYRYTRFTNGRYGEVGIPDSALDPDNTDIIIGGHNYSEDEDKDNSASDTHKTVTVKPKTGAKTPDDRIIVENENGIGAWNGSDSYVINAKNGRAYFSDSDRAYLDDDLQKDTTGYFLWTFTLYDAKTGEKCDAEPMQVASLGSDDTISIDLKDYKQTNTTTFKYYFENDGISSYKIKAEVEEVWAGHHTYKPKFHNWFYFNEYRSFLGIDANEAAEILDFTVTPRTPSSDCTSYTLNTENEEGMEYYFEFLGNNSKGAVTCNSYYRYCKVDTAGKTVLSSKQEIATGTEYGEPIEFIVPPKHGGPVYVTVEYVFRRSINSSAAVDVVTITKTHLAYALDFMTYDVLAADEAIRTGRVSASYGNYDTVELYDGETVLIKPNISADMAKTDVINPITGKTFSKSDIKWQLSTGLDDYGNHVWNDVPAREIVNQEIDGVTLPCVKTNRTAWYRMSYVWNGETYHSPQSLLVKGVSYEKNRIATVIRSDRFTGIYGKGENKLYLDVNKDADWNTGGCSVDSIRIFLMEKPDGANPGSTMKTPSSFATGQNGLIELINTDSFFENEAGAVTGMYTFRVRVTGTNADGSTYYVTANCDVWYSQQTTDLNIYVNGMPIYKHDEINIPCILTADTNLFDFTCDYYPLNTMGNGIDKSSVKWTSSDSGVLRIDEKTGEGLALRPGTVTVRCSWKDSDGASHSRSAKVSVPIAGFELNKIDYASYVGSNLPYISGEIATVKSVWSCGGEKVTVDPGRYIGVRLTSYNGWGEASTAFGEAVVEYNNNASYGYTVTAKADDGYFFAAEAEADVFETEYYVDKAQLRCNGLDDGAILPAEDYDAYTEWNTPYTVEIDYVNKTYNEYYKGGMYVRLSHVPVIEDPGAVYLKEVNVTVSEPAVGDNRYEGTTYNPMNEYLVLNVSGILGNCKDSSTHSYVSKLDMSDIRGTGKAYDDASSEEKGALTIEYMSVWNTTDYVTWNKPTKTYENGIYVHDVGLCFDSDAMAGMNVFVAKDAKIFVNGREMDFASVYYGSDGTSSVNFKYYFDVGEVETVSVVSVTGINAPLQGELPSDVGDATVLVGGVESDSVYISKLIWFVDANGNGAYDEGEEAQARYYGFNGSYRGDSTLWYDGRFLAGVSYSLCVELQADGVRLDSNVVVSFSGLEKNLIGKMSGVFTFPADNIIRTVTIDALTTDSAAGKFLDPFMLTFSGKTSGFSLNWTYNEFTECDDPTASVGEFIGDVITYSYDDIKLPGGKTWLRAMIMPEDGFQISNNFKFLVNGTDACEEFAPGRSNIETCVNSGGIYMSCYMFTVPKTGADVTVNVTGASGGKVNAQKTVQLIESGYSEAAYESVIAADGTSCVISGVPDGTYKVKVMAAGYVTAETTVTINGSDATVNVTLRTVSTTAAVKGTVYSKGSAADPVTLRLTLVGKSEPSYEVVVTGNKASYSIGNVENGTYVLTATKNGHSDYSIMVTVDGTDLTQNITLSLPGSLMGDVDGDGRITNKDLLLMRRYLLMVVGESETFCFDNADLDYDGRITNKDLLKLRKIIMGVE